MGKGARGEDGVGDYEHDNQTECAETVYNDNQSHEKRLQIAESKCQAAWMT